MTLAKSFLLWAKQPLLCVIIFYLSLQLHLSLVSQSPPPLSSPPPVSELAGILSKFIVLLGSPSGFSVRSLHVLLMFAWVVSRYSGFPHSPDTCKLVGLGRLVIHCPKVWKWVWMAVCLYVLPWNRLVTKSANARMHPASGIGSNPTPLPTTLTSTSRRDGWIHICIVSTEVLIRLLARQPICPLLLGYTCINVPFSF